MKLTNLELVMQTLHRDLGCFGPIEWWAGTHDSRIVGAIRQGTRVIHTRLDAVTDLDGMTGKRHETFDGLMASEMKEGASR